jgi:hypothetical protein
MNVRYHFEEDAERVTGVGVRVNDVRFFCFGVGICLLGRLLASETLSKTTKTKWKGTPPCSEENVDHRHCRRSTFTP